MEISLNNPHLVHTMAVHISGCGSNLALDYIISQVIQYHGAVLKDQLVGMLKYKSGGSLDINGNATFGGTLTNAGTVTVEASSDPATPTPPTSTFLTVSNISGHTKEDGTTSTFKVALKDDSHFPSNPSSSSAPSSDLLTVSAFLPKFRHILEEDDLQPTTLHETTTPEITSSGPCSGQLEQCISEAVLNLVISIKSTCWNKHIRHLVFA